MAMQFQTGCDAASLSLALRHALGRLRQGRELSTLSPAGNMPRLRRSNAKDRHSRITDEP